MKSLILTKELIEETLRTKIFSKFEDNYIIAQQTYQDFLIAKYLNEMKLPLKKINQILMTNSNYHPNLIESIAFLTIKNEKLFNNVIRQIPEKILFSLIYFHNTKHKNKLFKTYLRLSNIEQISFWNYQYSRIYFHKKLYYCGIEKELFRYLRVENKKTKKTILDFIQDNNLKGFEKICERLIFKSKNLHLKIAAIDTAEACKYEYVLDKVAQNISNFDKYINANDSDQMRGCILNALYPNHIDITTVLKYLEEPSDVHFFGRYRTFLSQTLPDNIDRNDSRTLLKWMKNNKIKSVVLSEYGRYEHSSCATKIFKKIANFINKDLIDEIVEFQLSSEFHYYFFSTDIFKKIVSNNIFRIYFMLNSKQLCELYGMIINKCSNINKTDINKIDELKEFADRIIQYFIENGDLQSYKRIKNLYLKDRTCLKTYKIYYKRGLIMAKHNMIQKMPLNAKDFAKIENKYYKEKGEINVQIGKTNINGDNNTVNIQENKKQKICISSKSIAFIIIIIVFTILLIFGFINFEQLEQVIKTLMGQ